MSRKSFFKDRSKLYLIEGKQLISITEAKAPALFQNLENNWKELEQKFNELNEDKSANEHKTPVFLYPNLEQYRQLKGELTKSMYMRIGFSINDVRVVIIEKETFKAIQKFEQKKKEDKDEQKNINPSMTIKEATIYSGTSSATVRKWIKEEKFSCEKVQKGKTYRYLIDKQSYLDFLLDYLADDKEAAK